MSSCFFSPFWPPSFPFSKNLPLKGRSLPTGVWGVPNASLSSSRRLRRREKQEKDVLRGHPAPRQRARRPLQSRLESASPKNLPLKGVDPLAGFGVSPMLFPLSQRGLV